MRDWYESLVPREQLLVGLGGLVAAVMLYFVLIWDPLTSAQKTLSEDVSAQRELVVFMQQAELQSAQFGRAGRSAGNSGNRSLLSLIDSSGKQSGMGGFIKRIQPEGETTVRLWIENAPFEQLVSWLHQLETQQSVTVENGSLDRDSKSGTVKARFSLVRSSS